MNPEHYDTPLKIAWLVKQEPEEYSWQQFVAEGSTLWTGVRNYQARNHLLRMQAGDGAFFYHSGKERQIVGIAAVSSTAMPDPTADPGESWVCVKLRPVKTLRHPVALADIKARQELAAMPLVRQSRLSVMPVSESEAAAILEMAGEELPLSSKTTCSQS